MAPEQMDGAAVDHRVDIYSLGVVFYEMLTGHLPVGSFERPSKCADVDARIDEVVMRSMAREPAPRYQHVIEIKTAVDGIRGKSTSSDLPFAIRSQHRDWTMFFGGLASIGLVALLYWIIETPWASLGLAIPSAFLAFWISRFRARMSVRWLAASVTACVLSATALIAVIATHMELSTFEKLKLWGFILCVIVTFGMLMLSTYDLTVGR